MARSVWKGPFVDGYLLKKAEKARADRAQRGDQDLVAPLDDPAAVRRPDLRRLQRPEVHPGARHREHGRPQVRRVLADPHLHRPLGRQEGEGGSCDEQANSIPAARRTTRPRPCCAPCASARASSTSWPPRSAARRPASAVNELDLLARSASRRTCKKALKSAIANAENNHHLDVDRLIVAEASVGKGLVMKRFHDPRPRPRRPASRSRSAISRIVVRERAERRRTA